MKNILLISSLFLLFSCGNPLIKETDAEVVISVNSMRVMGYNTTMKHFKQIFDN
jgi:hypothetical protein